MVYVKSSLAHNMICLRFFLFAVVKQEEAEFHEQSIRMERGVHFWPMLHLICLLVAAIMQVRHIVQFMHAKHIC